MQNSAVEHFGTLVHGVPKLRYAGEHEGLDPENNDPDRIISYGLCHAVVSMLSNVSQVDHGMSCHSDRVVCAGH